MEKYEQYQAIRRKTDDEWNVAINHFGMAKGQIMIIWTLYDFGRPCTQKEICDDWYENKQTINSAAKKLSEEGIIDIAPSPENSREKLLVFTEKGKFLAMRTVKKLIEVLDNFDRGIKAIETVEDCDKVKECYQLAYKNFNDVLSKIGLETIKAEGEEFDPNLHEAVMQTPTEEKPENIIISELQKGYKLGDKVLRPTLVNVATAP